MQDYLLTLSFRAVYCHYKKVLPATFLEETGCLETNNEGNAASFQYFTVKKNSERPKTPKYLLSKNPFTKFGIMK